jgi:Ca-activated chloride channel family protein
VTFARAELLWVGPLAAAVLAFALRVQALRLARVARALGGAAARRLLPVEPVRHAFRLVCLIVAALALGLAVAGPRFAASLPPPPPAPLDIAIAVDLSLSMTATDVAPSRLARARDVVVELTEALPGARISLVVFAHAPYVLVPPTDDHGVVRWFARGLAAEAVPDRLRGTSLSEALLLARRALDSRTREGARRAIVVVTDGGAHEGRDAVLAAAGAAAAGGVTILAAGVGTLRGAELGTPTEPLLDAQGARVLSVLDQDLLRALAAQGGGRYEDVSEAAGVRALVLALAASRPGPRPPGPLQDPAFWFALLALPLVLWEGALDAGRGLPRRARTGRKPSA